MYMKYVLRYGHIRSYPLFLGHPVVPDYKYLQYFSLSISLTFCLSWSVDIVLLTFPSIQCRHPVKWKEIHTLSILIRLKKFWCCPPLPSPFFFFFLKIMEQVFSVQNTSSYFSNFRLVCLFCFVLLSLN